MHKNQSIRTKSIVLKRVNYGEADRILTLLTQVGQISAIARGVRREKSKLAGGIELFGVSDITLQAPKTGTLHTITSSRLEKFYSQIVNDLERLELGYMAIKLIAKSSADSNEPVWFQLLRDTFAGLNDPQINRDLIEIWLLLNIAKYTGYEINLERDCQDNLLKPSLKYIYDINERGLRQDANGSMTADHIKFLRIINLASLKTAAQVGGVAKIMPQCLTVAREHAAVY